MSFPIIFFHHYGLTNQCLTKTCKKFHNEKTIDRKSGIFIKILSCLPVIGQIIGATILIIGIIDFKDGVHNYKEKKNSTYFNKVHYASQFFRGTLTIIGLGIVCLLIDIIITTATFIKNKI